jgi:hypothetical protein
MEKDKIEIGKCLICKELCEGYAHRECAIAIELIRMKRITFLIKKYGEGTLLYQNKLINWEE